jgi:hypothetical protein
MLGHLRREWPLITVLGLVFIGLVVVVDGHFRRGCVVIAFAIFLALFLRVLLPASGAGLLAVRSKRVDVIVLTVLATATTVLSLWVPPPNN